MPRFLIFLAVASCTLAAPQEDPVETKDYEIRSLTVSSSDSAWAAIGLDYQLPGRSSKPDTQAAPLDYGGLIELIKDQFPGAVWDADPTRIQGDGERLKLTAPRSLQAKVGPFLASIRAAMDRALILDAAVLIVDSARFDEIRSAPAAEQAAKLLQAGSLLKRGSVRAAPGRRVSLQDLTTESYVRDYDVQIATGAGDLDPCLNEFATGTCIDLRPWLDPEDGSVLLDVRGLVQDKEGVDEKKLRLQKDIEVVEGEGANVKRTGTKNLLSEVKVQQPRLSIQTVRSTVSARNGETVVVGAVKRGDGVLVCLVTPRVLPGPAPGAPRVIDLRGLRDARGDHDAPALSHPSHPVSDGFKNEEARRDPAFQHGFNELTYGFKERKEPELVALGDTLLVVPATARGQAEVAKFVASVRSAPVTCEALVVAFRKGARGDWEAALDLTKPVDDALMTKLRAEAAKGGKVRALESAEVTALSGQQSYVARLHERTYVFDYEPQVSTLVSIFDPIIGHLRTGFVFQARPGAGTIEIHAAFSEAELKETGDIATGVGLLQQPKISGLSWTAEVACEVGRWTVVGIESRGQGEAFEDVALFVRMRSVR